jgi:long-chain acyl-CoA synthetase
MAQKPPFDISRQFSRRHILFAGATGFVGKVALSMLLHRYGEEVGKIWVLVRKGSSASAEQRFFDKIATSEPFEPLRAARGEKGALEFLRSRCAIIEGDITDPHLGLSPEQVNQLRGQIHAVVNCAGLVSFTPSLEVGLKVNTVGVQNVVELCQAWDAPLVHVSTAFVAGNRSGLVFEDEEVAGYFPKKNELDGRDFSLQQELEDARRIVARLREEADDKALASTFRKRALERLAEEGRDGTDEKVLRLAMGRERKLWLSNELVRAGMERAQHWGWPNTYTYTKSLGEQVLAATEGLSYAIVRPSIVESALRFPFPGWNEGFTTSAPLCYAAMKGHRGVPASTKSVLDLIPVDLVAGALLAITARAMQVKERRVYHLASGDSNPFVASRAVELVGLYRRKYFHEKEAGNRFLNRAKARLEPMPLTREAYERTSAPMISQTARLLRGFMEQVQPRWGAPRVSALIDRAKEKLSAIEEQSNSLSMLIELFLPFVWQNRYHFRCDNIRALYAGIREEDRAKIPWDPEAVNWREYFLEIHLPGLEKWVFPGLDEERERKGVAHAHRDLLELFEASVHNHRHRVAFRRRGEEREERFTYAEVDRYAGRVASFLARCGASPSAPVLLLCENRPEWGVCYFGILRAGSTAVPVDPELAAAEVVDIAKRCNARVCLLSEEAARRLPGLHGALTQAGLHTQVHSVAQAMAGDGAFADGIGPYKRSRSPDDVASILFAPGGTDASKGIMLTHRNFASLVNKMAHSLPLDAGDSLLSVLPLHHAFEFSSGFLLPFSRGAEITYVDEVTSERVTDVLRTGRVTAMVGSPALWQLLHRSVSSEISSKPSLVQKALETMVQAHGELRERTQVNLGKLFFWPLHRKLGGRLRFMVSGGAPLPEEVTRAFYALGFQLSQSYGPTEAAVALALTDSSEKPQYDSAGKALPGIELRIDAPDANGVGEVLARGPNVMAGYLGDSEGTHAVLKDGWLRTGDLGRLDEAGRLFLIGKKKETSDAAGEAGAQVQPLVNPAGASSAQAQETSAAEAPSPSELLVPEPLARAGRALLSMGQKFVYGSLFEVQVSGKNNVPPHTNFLVVANHASHLDMGLIKVVLGAQGQNLTALAARDYFFSTPLRRAYFENFTNLIPMDRKGSLRESLRLAGDALRQGFNLLLFPEGTRSLSGELGEFKPTLGYLALSYRVPILPLYLQGTREALPKGKVVPQLRPLHVRIGPLLPWEWMREQTRGMSRSESYRHVTRLAEQSVKALRDGNSFPDESPDPQKEGFLRSGGGTE